MNPTAFSIIKSLILRPKIGGSLLLAIFLFYQVGMEMVFKGQLADIKATDDSIVSKTADVEKRKDMVKRYSTLSESIKSLPLQLAALAPGESPKIKAVSLAGQIQQLIQPMGAVSPSRAPGDSTEDGTLPPGPGGLTLIDISAKEPVEQDLLGTTFATVLQPKLEGQLTSVKVWEFPYTLQVKGSTVALVRLINALTQMEPLVVVNALDFKLDDKAETLLKYAPQAIPAAPAPSSAEAVIPESSTPTTTTSQQPLTAPAQTTLNHAYKGQPFPNQPVDNRRRKGGSSGPGSAGLPNLPGVSVPAANSLPEPQATPTTSSTVNAAAQPAPVIMILDLSLFIQDDTLQP